MARFHLSIACWLLLCGALQVEAQEATHRLVHTPPPDVFRAGAEDYSSNGFNASVQVYQFRPFSGNIQQMFQASLPRDWIEPMHQESNVGGPPTFQRLDIPGAQLALTAAFAENIAGLPKPPRMVIVAGGEAPIVDASAGTAQSWQRAVPALNTMAATLRVEASRAPAPLSPRWNRTPPRRTARCGQ